MSLSGSMHDRMFGGPTSGGYPSSYPANGMLASMGRQEGSRMVQSGMPVQYGYGQPMSQPMSYGQQMYSHDPDPTVSAREPPPVSMNSFMQHPNISQYNMQASMRERYAGWIRPCMCWKCTLMTAAGVHCQGGDDDQQGARQTSVGGRGCDPFEHGSFTTFMFCCALACSCVLFELTQSRAECERLAASLRNNEGGNQQLSEEYRMLRYVSFASCLLLRCAKLPSTPLSVEYVPRQQMENKENEYRRLWSNEEARIRGISEETRKTVDNIRSNLIGAYRCSSGGAILGSCDACAVLG
eukprot:3879779-Rhodomonas_salina.2